MFQASRRLRQGLACAALLGCVLAARGGETPKKTALIVVRVPADAELYFDTFKCKTGGAVREFETPPLAGGKKFGYRVRAVWTEKGKEVSRETRAVVRAGDKVEVDLLRLPMPEPEKRPPPPRAAPKEEKKPEPPKTPEADKKEKKPAPQTKPLPEKKPGAEKPVVPVPTVPEKKPEAKKASPPAPVVHPSLRLVMPETLTLQPGQTKLLPIKVVRTDLEGPVRVTFDSLPPGVTIKETVIAAGKDRGYVEAAATKETAPQEVEVSVTGRAGLVRQRCALKVKIGR